MLNEMNNENPVEEVDASNIKEDKKPFPENRFIDTLKIARFLFPKVPNNQDALCKRFDINNYNRLS